MTFTMRAPVLRSLRLRQIFAERFDAPEDPRLVLAHEARTADHVGADPGRCRKRLVLRREKASHEPPRPCRFGLAR